MSEISWMRSWVGETHSRTFSFPLGLCVSLLSGDNVLDLKKEQGQGEGYEAQWCSG